MVEVFSFRVVDYHKELNECDCLFSLKGLQNIFSSQKQLDQVLLMERPPESPTKDPSLISVSTLGSTFVISTGGDRSTADVLKNANRERRALTRAFDISLKALIDKYTETRLPFTDDDELVLRFCIVLEHMFMHGFKGRRSLWSLGLMRETYFDFIQSSLASDTRERTRQLMDTISTGFKSSLSRGRAWIRLTLMDQTFASQFSHLLQDLPYLNEFYEPWALLRSDDSVLLAGAASGLNSVEFNLCLKGEDLDAMDAHLDWSVFMRNGNVSVASDSQSSLHDGNELVQALQSQLAISHDQKAFAEQYSKELEQKLEDGKQTFAVLKQSFVELEKEHAEQARLYSDVRVENARLQREMKEQQAKHDHGIQGLQNEVGLAQDKSSSLQKELEEVQQHLKDVLIVRNELEERLQKLSGDSGDLDAQRLKDREVLKATQEHLVNAIKHKEELKSKLELERERALAAEDQWETLRQRVAELDSVHAQLEETQVKWRSSEHQVEKLRQQINQLINQQTSGSDASATAIQSLQFEVKSLSQQLADANRRCESLEREGQGYAMDNQHLERMLAEKDQALLDLARAHGKAQQEIQELSSQERLYGTAWVADHEAQECQSCSKSFNLNRRRHHCRACGKIFCHSCSDHWVQFGQYAHAVRVCNRCVQTKLK